MQKLTVGLSDADADAPRMSYTYELAEPPGCVVVTWSGELTADEYLAFYKDFSEHPEFHAGLHRLYDFRKADIRLSHDDLRNMAGKGGMTDDLHGRRRVAILVRDYGAFSLMRLNAALVTHLKADIKVTMGPLEARSWAETPPGYVLPADR